MIRRNPSLARDVGDPRPVELRDAPRDEPRDEFVSTASPVPWWSAPARRGEPVKLLFLSANTEGAGALRLDEAPRAIDQAIRAAHHRDSVQLIAALAARRGDLRDGLLRHR